MCQIFCTDKKNINTRTKEKEGEAEEDDKEAESHMAKCVRATVTEKCGGITFL